MGSDTGPPDPYGISGSHTDGITFSILWHDCETKARLVHAFYHSSGVDRTVKKKVMRYGSMPAKCKSKQNFPGFIVLSQKRSSPLDCMPWRIYWALQAIAIARLMFIVHDWFICTPDLSCCTDKISLRM